MTDRGRRLGKGIAIALAVHIVAAALLGILGYRFTQRPPQILEVTLGGGGGGGGGITITPVAFIVIEKGKCRMMQINNYTSSADRAVSMIPELVDKLTELLKAKDGKADEAETPAAE